MDRLIPAFVFVFVLLCVLGFYSYLEDRRAEQKQNILARISNRKISSRSKAKGVSGSSQLLKSLGSDWQGLDALDSLRIQAGLKMPLETLIVIALSLGGIFALASFFIFRSIVPTLICGAAGIGVPILYLIRLRQKREAAMVEQLPDALDFMVRALRAGQSIDNAMHGVGSNFADPIGSEIRKIYADVSLGLPFIEALRRFEGRFPRVADIKFLCTSFIVQRETGGNLTEALASLSDTIRKRFALEMQIRALTAEGRLTAVFLAMLPVAFAAVSYVLNPDYILFFFTEEVGRNLLFVAFILDIAGFAIMRKMAKIDI